MEATELQNARCVSVGVPSLIDHSFVARQLPFDYQSPLDPPERRMKPKHTSYDVNNNGGKIVPAANMHQLMS
jgi:hypothetical protein